MAFNEIVKAIQWSTQSSGQYHYDVAAYLVLHNGLASTEPVTTLRTDQVWYVRGNVYAVATPTPHLAGTLTNVQATNSDGDLTAAPKRSVSVEIFPDGKLSVLQLINGKPTGGLPARQLHASDVMDNLMVAIDGSEVWTLGVARVPMVQIPQ
jgi:hypothetical protein